MSKGIGNSDRYIIESEDSGGSSIVYKARDTKLNAYVAIKAPAPGIVNNPGKLAKFEEEARMLARIKNDNVISVRHFYEAGELDTTCLLVTEWMDRSLADVLRSEKLSPSACMQILHKIASGMFAIHQQDIIHRDMKPENIFLSSDASEVKIGDLGIASDVGVEQSTLTVTPKYTAPENYHQEMTVGRQSDIYALGMIAYEMLLGKEAFEREFEAIYSVESEKVRTNRWTHWHMNTGVRARPLAEINPEIPKQLSDIVERMMAKDLSERYMDVSEILSDLQGIAGSSISFVAPLSLDDLDEDNRSAFAWFLTPMGLAVTSAVIVIVAAVVILFPRGTPGTSLDEVNGGIEYISGLRDKAILAGADDSLSSFAEAERLYREAEAAFGVDDYDLTMTRLVESEPFFMAAYDDAWLRRLAVLDGEAIALKQSAEKLRVLPERLKPVSATVDTAYAAREAKEYSDAGTAFEKAIAQYEEAILSAPRLYRYGSTAGQIDEALAVCREHQRGCARSWYEDELEREAILLPFEMDTTEVTNRGFDKFVEASGHRTDAAKRGSSNLVQGFGIRPTPDLNWSHPTTVDSSYLTLLDAPVVHVSARDAEAYCGSIGRRLPSEAEWEYSARGTDGRVYAWGDEWDARLIAFNEKSEQPPALVGSHPRAATPKGLQDMTGSVWEWTSTEANSTGIRVAKGGSRLDGNPANMRAAVRRIEEAGYTSNDIGFRCAATLKAWPAPQ